ncbi:hypothetical protein [Polaribacter sp. IC073]|uniref:hypothetical protein n=1 Tax=Polaribacter sp. IC073 TaxID=2508540 RepID=UPI0011BF8E1D|nr:hypothetical protein [Polaribacter sp. IC073]TXD45869.1 hypothetical protein ES045_15710 [Polaribacter sp. IC073]
MILVLAVIFSAGTFLHFFQEKNSIEISSHLKLFPEIKKTYNKSLDDFSKTLNNEQQKELLELRKTYETEFSSYISSKKEILKKDSFVNHSNKRSFFFALFMMLLPFISCSLWLYSMYNRNDDLLSVFKKAAYVLLGVSTFWVIWVFLNNIINDNNIVYLLLFVAVAFTIAHSVFEYFKYLDKIPNYKYLIRTLIGFVYRVQREDYIKEEKYEKYTIEKTEIVNKIAGND